MAKKAVLVGCNYPGTEAELRGCINDVIRIKQSLMDRFGFNETDISVLVDTDSSSGLKPTGFNIKQALHGLVSGSKSGDVLFFHYSGHGVRLPVEPGDPDTTGFDECIVPCDMNLISDDDFREVVNKLPLGVGLTMISDSCHSGGLIENEKEQIGESSLPELVSSHTIKKPARKHKENGGAKKPSKGKGKRDLEMSDGDVDRDCDNSSSDDELTFHKIHNKMREKLQKRGIHLDHQYIAHDEHFQNIGYMGDEKYNVKSRALPLSTLMTILKQKTGKEMYVHNIRASIIDIHPKDRTSEGKIFMRGVLVNGKNKDKSSSHSHDNVVGPKKAVVNVNCKNNKKTMKYTADMGVLVSGCQSHETSADASGQLGNEGYGAMSNAIQIVLSQNHGSITNYELVSKIREILKKQGFTQQPGLYCSDENAKAPFIC